jgi:hypothetical protein
MLVLIFSYTYIAKRRLHDDVLKRCIPIFSLESALFRSTGSEDPLRFREQKRNATFQYIIVKRRLFAIYVYENIKTIMIP